MDNGHGDKRDPILVFRMEHGDDGGEDDCVHGDRVLYLKSKKISSKERSLLKRFSYKDLKSI